MARTKKTNNESPVAKVGGRKKGTQNIITQITKANINELIEELIIKIRKNNDLDELTAKERVDAFIKLSQFVVPKATPDVILPEGATDLQLSYKRVIEAATIKIKR